MRELGRALGLPMRLLIGILFLGLGWLLGVLARSTAIGLPWHGRPMRLYMDQIRAHGLYDEIWQAFVAVLPVQSVGVMGDARSYDYACALRAVCSVDGMTADLLSV